jgi:osmotically-inducible protein OsmY
LFVADGIVTVEGFVTDEAFAQALCAVARDVAGADKVCDGLMRVDAVSGSVLVMA